MSFISSKTIRAGLTLVLATGVLSTFTGCTDGEIAASALIIGAAAIASGGGGGEVRYHDHGGYGGGFHRHNFDATVSPVSSSALDAQVSALTAPAFVSSDARVIQLAANYGISDYAATHLVRAIVMAEAKDTTGVKELGLSVNDFKDLYDGRQLASDKIAILGAKLKMDDASATRLVQDMTSDVQAEKAARGL